MMVKTRELIGDQLDWAVREALINSEDSRGRDALISETVLGIKPAPYSKWWMFGGVIIERGFIELNTLPAGLSIKNHPTYALGDVWEAMVRLEGEDAVGCCGPTPLIAAMRCFVASKFGDEVDIPDELL